MEIDQEIQKLHSRREELRERLEAIHSDYNRGLDRDAEEQAQQLENAEVLEGLERAAAEELEAIEKRLLELGEA